MTQEFDVVSLDGSVAAEAIARVFKKVALTLVAAKSAIETAAGAEFIHHEAWRAQ